MLIEGLVARVKALPIREAKPASRMLLSLEELGWQRSARAKASIDAAGMPLPWWTYSATRWLDLALGPRHKVFEFGSGNSTLWLAQRVATVLSVEHDPAWDRHVRAGLPPNVKLELRQVLGGSADAHQDDPYLEPMRVVADPFDFVVIDGMARNSCAELAVDHLAEDGIILLDDSDRLIYRPAHATLAAAGFGRIDFFGAKPGVGHMSTTSIFCRDLDVWARSLPPPIVSGH